LLCRSIVRATRISKYKQEASEKEKKKKKKRERRIQWISRESVFLGRCRRNGIFESTRSAFPSATTITPLERIAAHVFDSFIVRVPLALNEAAPARARGLSVAKITALHLVLKVTDLIPGERRDER